MLFFLLFISTALSFAPRRKVEKILERALALQQRVLGEHHPNLIEPLRRLAQTYALRAKHSATEGNGEELTRRRFAEAERLYMEALNITQAVYGLESKETATFLKEIGQFLEGFPGSVRESDARKTLEESVRIFEKLAKSKLVSGMEVTDEYHNIAEFYRKCGDRDAVRKYCQGQW